MVFKRTGKKKTLDKISAGELKMLSAELECRIAALNEDVRIATVKIDAFLSSAEIGSHDAELEFAARELSNQLRIRADLRQRLASAQNKRFAVDRLISIKEEMINLSHSKADLLDLLDTEALCEEQEERNVREGFEKMRIENILSAAGEETRYEKILETLKAVNRNEKTVANAREEMELFTSEQ